MTSYPIRHNGKTVETHDNLRSAVRAFWILSAHELKNGRAANLYLNTGSSHGIPDPSEVDLPDWVREVLKEHGL